MFRYLNDKNDRKGVYPAPLFFRKKSGAGFSLVEILIVIFFMSMLFVLGFVNYREFEQNISLSTAANEMAITLDLASNRTTSSKGDSVYGVHFATSSYTLFKGSVYSSLGIDNEVFSLPSSVEIYNIDISGGNDVVFNKISGTTDNTGEIGLRIINKPEETKIIKISESGRAGFGDTIIPTGARIVDSRHVHFDLGWSMQGENNLVLDFDNFPNPDVQEIINMPDFFNAGETEFSWIGTVDVDGESQTLEVHTHALDAFNTELCIHRDGRTNTKALDISVGGKDIVSYTSDGVATVGLFGGAMTVQ